MCTLALSLLSIQMPRCALYKKIVLLFYCCIKINTYFLASHSYLINYKRIRKFNATLTENIASMFQFSIEMKAAVLQHSQLCVVYNIESPCDVS